MDSVTVGEAIGIGLGFLAIVAPDFWPKMPRSFSYTLAAIGLGWLTYSGILALEEATEMKLRYGPLTMIVVGALVIACGIFWHISRLEHPTKRERAQRIEPSPSQDNQTIPQQLEKNTTANDPIGPQEPSLLTLFMNDFRMKFVGASTEISRDLELDGGKEKTRIFYNIHYDFSARTKFAAFYIQPTNYFNAVCKFIADDISQMLEQDSSTLGFGWKMQGESTVENMKDIPFSGRVYIYAIGAHDILELAEITKYFRDKGIAIQFRSDDYALGAQENIRMGRVKALPTYVIRDNFPVLATPQP
jgi:hypothetical protein